MFDSINDSYHKKSCCVSIGPGAGKSDLMVMESADDVLTRKEKDGV